MVYVCPVTPTAEGSVIVIAAELAFAKMISSDAKIV
jgi:hypothetical protein